MTPEELEQLWRYHEQRLNSFDDQLSRLIEEERESARIAREHLETIRESTRRAIEQSNARIAESNARIAESEARIAESEARIAESNARIAESEARTAEAIARIDRLENYAVRSFRMGVEAIRRERVQRRKLEESFEQRLERSRQDSDARMTRIERAIEALLRSKNGGSAEANGHV